MYSDKLVYKVVIWKKIGISLWKEKVALKIVQQSHDTPENEPPGGEMDRT